MSDLDPSVVDAWAAVADGYARYWTPRFRPFVSAAVERFEPAPGPLAVVGCGPGDEVLALAERFPAQELIATDPAAPMVALARERLAGTGAEVLQRSASDLPARGLGGLFSSFVLQLLPDRELALRAWREALAPEGVAAALFWPRQPDESAWGRMGRAVERVCGKGRPDWEPALRERLPALRLSLESHDLVFAITHESPEAAWAALRDACSYQVLLRRLGPEATEACGRAWLDDHGLTRVSRGWAQEATARLWLLRPAC